MDLVEDDPRGAGIDAARYRQVLGHFPTGVTVITADTDDGPAGFAVGSFTSLSLDPPLVAFMADHGSQSWPAIRAAGAFCVNVLADDQEEVCRVFASKAEDKFTGIGWTPAGTGSPRLVDVVAWIDCDLESVLEGGDHHIAVGRVLDLGVDEERHAGPLLFYRGGYGRFTSS